MAFILEADKGKNILRQTHISGHVRRENDAEYAWHMAMMVYLLREYANEEFDLAKVMDNFQPLILNGSNGGADWREHQVTKSKVVGRQQTSRFGSENIWKYTEELINANVERGNIINE